MENPNKPNRVASDKEKSPRKLGQDLLRKIEEIALAHDLFVALFDRDISVPDMSEHTIDTMRTIVQTLAWVLQTPDGIGFQELYDAFLDVLKASGSSMVDMRTGKKVDQKTAGTIASEELGKSIEERVREMAKSGIVPIKERENGCNQCGMIHEENEPHFNDSIRWMVLFYQKNNRLPTWKDCVSHLALPVRIHWIKRLREEYGIDV